MASIFKWLLRGFLALCVVLALAGVGVWVLIKRSVPDYSGRVAVAGVSAPVEIVRDGHAVPHIFGETDADVFFGLGYAHAQDRLWQMTMMRRAAQGRLSELFGARTVGVDDFLRRLDLHRLSQAALPGQSAETIAALDAYATGVNARIAEVNEKSLGRGAPEFFMFPAEIAPWQPADSLSILRLMALRLSAHLEDEVQRALVDARIGAARLADIMPAAPGDGTVDLAALPAYRDLFPGLPRALRYAGAWQPGPFDPVPLPDFAGASNAWAAMPSRAAKGGSLLANDPHLGLSAPTIWMLARLELEAGPVIGGTIPGMPAVLVGRNAKVAWGLTSSYLDDQDVFIEELNPSNPDEYRTPDGWKPFRKAETRIRVKGGETVTATLRWTDNGPVIPGDRYNLAAVTPPGHVATVGWTVLDADDRSMTAGIRLMQAQTVAEAIEAGRAFKAPAQNLTIADAQSIAIQLIGAVPRRSPAHQTRGQLPAPGWVAENRWDGYMPYEANPRTVDPGSGAVGNTNNKTVERAFPANISHTWGDTQRIRRLTDLMGGRDVHTLESFVDMQQDAVSFTARSLLPLIGADLWYDEAAPTGTPRDQRRAAAMKRLGAWTGEMNEHAAEPLVFAAWLRNLALFLARDGLGPLIEEFPRPDPVFVERVFRDTGGASVWCDVVPTAATETCAEMAKVALDAALDELSAAYGEDMGAWRWGDAHVAAHDHEVLGGVPVLSWFVNIRQSTSGGDNTLLRGRTSGTGENPYLNVHGSGYRGAYDMADPDSSLFVTSTGQSGHFLSRHYDDLAVLWRRGEYIPMRLDPDLARAGAIGTLVLEPKD